MNAPREREHEGTCQYRYRPKDVRVVWTTALPHHLHRPADRPDVPLEMIEQMIAGLLGEYIYQHERKGRLS